jgi:ABC-type antimicrobial peptide transport system permease subunit
MALGEAPGQALGRVLRGALGIAAIGIVAGAAVALIGADLLGSFVAGVPPRDVGTLAIVCAAFLLGAFLAAIGPALRASAVAPAEIIRQD